MIFGDLKQLYCSSKLDWIKEAELSGFLAMKWVMMNNNEVGKLFFIDKYTFHLNDEEMLSLLSACLIPKQQKTPFVKFIKKKEDTPQYDFILPQIQKYFEYSDREFEIIKPIIIKELEKDYKKWFDFFGIDEKYYEEYGVEIKKVEKIKEKKGLSVFFGGV